MRGEVVARERIVGPAGQQQTYRRAGRVRTQIERQRVLPRVALDGIEIEAIRIPSIDGEERVQDITAPIVGGAHGRARRSDGVQRERPPCLRRSQALVRIDVHSAGMVDCHQLQSIDEQRFLELVGHAQLVLALPSRKLAGTNPDVLVRIRHAAQAGAFPRAHLTASHEVGHELES